MLKNVDPTLSLSKERYKELMPDLERELGRLQRQARAAGIPVAIIFEGWDASGKGTLIGRLMRALDPRGFSVWSQSTTSNEERWYPFLWRFWAKTPEKGRFAIFDRGWFAPLIDAKVSKSLKKSAIRRLMDDVVCFERQLVDDGTLIVKFFLHISKEEQKKRFKKLQSDPATAWRVGEEDLRRHRDYDKYVAAIDESLELTDTERVTWRVIEAGDERWAIVRIYETLIAAIKARLDEAETGKKKKAVARNVSASSPAIAVSPFKNVDLSLSMEREEYDKLLRKKQKRLRELEFEIYQKRIPVVAVFEGWDAAGKGGNIKRLTEQLDPRGYDVLPVAAPTDIEKAHHYLWRFWTRMPKAGHIGIFDRSWYGRVLVERVEGFCSPPAWRRAFDEINEMERHLSDYGAVVAKFWLHIDQETQLARFKERQSIPDKQWKITDEDWRNREKWKLYLPAVEEMLARTSTSHAPWTIVESKCKLHARIKVLQTVIDAIEERL